MEFWKYVRAHNWATAFGYLLFTGMMAVGYYYNLTFVQFGLLDLGTRLIGMSRQAVASQMSVMALLTCLMAIAFGWWMKRQGWGQRFLLKLRLAFGVVLAQTVLTAVAPFLRSQAAFSAWILVASLALGVGVPVTFSMTSDLIPRRDRGHVAAWITGAAFFFAASLSSMWTIEQFSAQILVLMLAGAAGLGFLAFKPSAWIEALARQHSRPEFWYGRYVRLEAGTCRTRLSRRLLLLILLMFGIFFIDSLGFLRLADTPAFFRTAWQSPDLQVRLFIGIVHVAAALIAGVLYTAMDERKLFLWIFGIFALVHFMYVFNLRILPAPKGSLGEAMLYAIAVSLYTVVNFAIWADVSTPRTISLNTALGVALSGWTATFLSTALALRWAEMPAVSHLNIVDALAMLFFVLMLALSLWPSAKSVAEEPEQMRSGEG